MGEEDLLALARTILTFGSPQDEQTFVTLVNRSIALSQTVQYIDELYDITFSDFDELYDILNED